MLTGAELTFMGVTGSKSHLFSAPGLVVSPVGKRRKRKNNQTKMRRAGRKNGIEKEWREGRKNEKRSEER